MKLTEQIVLNDAALVSWYMLPEESREQLLATLTALAGRPVADWPQGVIERWFPHDDLYALHFLVDADELLVFFRSEEGQVHIERMILKETIDRFARRA